MGVRPVLLLSNDDGILAEGLVILARHLRAIGRVVVVAPDRQQSASSHSLTLHRPLRIFQKGPNCYAVDGTPTDCITLGVNAILKKKPDLVVSGINGGFNLGDDVHYSGTVSAALEGALMGIPSVAVSLGLMADEKGHYDHAARFTCRVLKLLLKRSIPAGALLNINVPNRPPSEIKGYAWTRLGRRDYGQVLFEKLDPQGKKYYWVSGTKKSFQDIPGSDGNAILERKISMTPLQVDLTHHPLLADLANIKF